MQVSFSISAGGTAAHVQEQVQAQLHHQLGPSPAAETTKLAEALTQFVRDVLGTAYGDDTVSVGGNLFIAFTLPTFAPTPAGAAALADEAIPTT